LSPAFGQAGTTISQKSYSESAYTKKRLNTILFISKMLLNSAENKPVKTGQNCLIFNQNRSQPFSMLWKPLFTRLPEHKIFLEENTPILN